MSLFLSDVETVTWQPEEVTGVAGRCDRLLVTEGDKGAKQYMQGQSQQVQPTKVRSHILVGYARLSYIFNGLGTCCFLLTLHPKGIPTILPPH